MEELDSAGLLPNWTHNWTENEIDFSEFEISKFSEITVTLIYSLVCLFGTIGNVLVIFVVFRNKDMRNSMNIFLVNLTVADLLVLLVCVPNALLEFYNRDVWTFGEAMCRFLPFLEHCVAHASVLTIMAISVERFIAITNPLSMPTGMTAKTLKIILIIIWVISIGTSLPFSVITKLFQAPYYDGTMKTVCSTTLQEQWERVYGLADSIIFLGLPLIIIVVLYAIMIKELLVTSRGLLDTDGPGMYVLRTRRQAVLMLMCVAILFFVCSLPFHIFVFYLMHAPVQELEKLGLKGFLGIGIFVRVLLHLNSAINPIVYNIVSTRFRRAFKQIFTSKCIGKICKSQQRRQRLQNMTYIRKRDKYVPANTTVMTAI